MDRPQDVNAYTHNGVPAVYLSRGSGSNIPRLIQEVTRELECKPDVPINLPNVFPKYAGYESKEEVLAALRAGMPDGYTVYAESDTYYLVRKL